ncbi:MAG: hypothetical protein ACI4EF_00065 [Coprococcus sp.]
MKTFLKILIALIIVAALCVGIYYVLPETPQMYIKGNIQYRTDDEAKKEIDIVKSNIIKVNTVADNGTKKTIDTGVTYGDALEKTCKSTVWYYETGADGSRTITFNGSKASLDLSKYGSDGTFINKSLKLVFYFPTSGNGTVTVYVGGNILNDTDKIAALQAIAANNKMI